MMPDTNPHGVEGASDKTLRDTRILTFRIWSIVGLLIIGSMLLNVMGVLAPVIEFLAIGSLIAFVEAPIVNALEHRGVPRAAGALVGLLVVVTVVVLVFTLLLPMFFDQILDVLNMMPRYLATLQIWATDLLDDMRSMTANDTLSSLNDLLVSLQRNATVFVTDLATDLGRGVMPFIGSFANTMFIGFLGLVLAYWFACDYPTIHGEIGRALGGRKEDDYRFLVAILSRSVGGYMRSTIITSVINGVLVFIALLAIGHPYAGLMGVITAIFHLIPVIGPVFSAAIAVIIAFFYGPSTAIWTLVLCVIAQNITDNVISPKVMQSTVQVHPAMSLAAIVIGSALMGPLGMVVAIPLCAALKGLFIFYFEQTTERQLVSYDGAIFKGTPFLDDKGNPVPAFDALGDDRFVAHSEILDSDVMPDATVVPKPKSDLEIPWPKLTGLQSGGTGVFKMPFGTTDTAGEKKPEDDVPGEDDGR